MSIYHRPKVEGATVFFTVALARRGSTLLVDEVARLREAVRATRATRPFVIDTWVVLPDHLHAVWTLPPGDRDFSTRWGAIKARFTMAVRQAGFTPPDRFPVVTAGRYAGVAPGIRHHKGEVALWQRRFWEHHIRDERDYRAHVRYCWINPVKHGFVARPEEWRFSSVHWDERFQAGKDMS